MGQKHNIIKGKKPFRRILREKITFGHFFSEGGGSNKFRHFAHSYRHDLREYSIFWITGLYNTSHQRAKKWIKCPLLMAQFEEKFLQANCNFATLFYIAAIWGKIHCLGQLGSNVCIILEGKKGRKVLSFIGAIWGPPPQIVICLSLSIV